MQKLGVCKGVFQIMKSKIVIIIAIFFSFLSGAQVKEYNIEKANDLREVENKPMIVLFSTDWCSVCKIQKRELKEIPKEFWDKVYFVSINPEKFYKDIHFLGKKYSYISNGTSGLHSLVYSLAGNKPPAYPFWVFVDDKDKIVTYQGLLNSEDFKSFIR